MIVPVFKIFISALIVLFLITSYYLFFTNRGKSIGGWMKFGIIFFGSTLGSALFMLFVLSTTNEITIVQEDGKYSNINIWGDYTVTDGNDNTIVKLVNLDLFENYLYNGSGRKLIQYPVEYSSDGNSTTDKQPLLYEDGMLGKREYGINYYFTLPPDTIVTETRKSRNFLINMVESLFYSGDETKWVLDYATDGDIPFSIRTARLEKVIEELNQNCPITVIEGCTFRGIAENGDTLVHTYVYNEDLAIAMQKEGSMDFMKSMVRNNPLLRNLLIEYNECGRILVLSIEKTTGDEVYRMVVNKEEMKEVVE